MTREHSPRPGASWETQPVRTEQVVEDGQPEPRPNRAARRAAARRRRSMSRTDLPDIANYPPQDAT